MPLNIDWQQILLHIFNFVILAGGLYLILYKPVKDFMQKREDYYKNIENQTNEKLAAADKAKKEYEQRLKDVDEETAEKKNESLKEAEKLANSEVAIAKEEAAKIIEHAKAEAKIERERIVVGAQNDITKLAVAAAKKIIESDDKDALDRFISIAKKEVDND